MVLSAAGVLPVILVFNLNDAESGMLSFESSLWFCHAIPVFVKLLLYSIRRYIDITRSRSLALSTNTLFISLLRFLNGAQFLKVTSLFLASALASMNHCSHKGLTLAL